MTETGKKKLKASLWSLLYVAIAVSIVVSSVFIFKNFYFEVVFVNGGSMNPTLCGGDAEGYHDYGINDKSYGAKRGLKRFQVVTTYYPYDEGLSNPSYKIKRVIGLPGDTLKVEHNDLYLYDRNTLSWKGPMEMPFTRNLDGANRNQDTITLKDDEYFLAGDNWVASTDSFDPSVGPIKFSLLVGAVVRIEGRAKVNGKTIYDKIPYSEPMYFLGVDY